jgi:hypothetical protein
MWNGTMWRSLVRPTDAHPWISNESTSKIRFLRFLIETCPHAYRWTVDDIIYAATVCTSRWKISCCPAMLFAPRSNCYTSRAVDWCCSIIHTDAHWNASRFVHWSCSCIRGGFLDSFFRELFQQKRTFGYRLRSVASEAMPSGSRTSVSLIRLFVGSIDRKPCDTSIPVAK